MIRWQIDEHPTPAQIDEIAAALEAEKVILLPTDTIYGLHALARSQAAVDRIVAVKGREETKPFIVLVSSVDQLEALGVAATPDLLEALGDIWPAPLTTILPLRSPIPASRGAATLAVRIPALDWLRALLVRTGPLVSTSANRSGDPAVEHPFLLARELQSGIDGIADAGTRTGEASAILDLTSDEPRFIRESELFFTQNLWKTLLKKQVL
ncbi:MAG TPA: L-threonylcarbamoyladenylate synthase [Thermoanaerobaculia bacterium]